jgi:hypothetical protein
LSACRNSFKCGSVVPWDHAHLAVPVELWREKYTRIDAAQLLPQILHDPALIALYHSAEHLSVTASTGSPIAAQVKRWKAKRNVLGFYDSRPARILPPPERLDSYDEIIAAAKEEQCDLIVMTGREGSLRRLFGASVTERVVRHAPCPVLSMRPSDRSLGCLASRGFTESSRDAHRGATML